LRSWSLDGARKEEACRAGGPSLVTGCLTAVVRDVFDAVFNLGR
jgi:hypothetical protein